MNVKDIFMGGPSDQKVNAYLGYITRDGLNESEILYMGDDLPDLPILSRPQVLSSLSCRCRCGGAGYLYVCIDENRWPGCRSGCY